MDYRVDENFPGMFWDMENPDIKVKTLKNHWKYLKYGYLDKKLVLIESQSILVSPTPLYDRLQPRYSNWWHSKGVAVGKINTKIALLISIETIIYGIIWSFANGRVVLYKSFASQKY